MKRRLHFLDQLASLTEYHGFSQGFPYLLRNHFRLKDFSLYDEKNSMTGFNDIDLILEKVYNFFYEYIPWTNIDVLFNHYLDITKCC